MSRIRVIAAKLLAPFDRKRRERDLEEEILLHLEMQIERNLARGMPPDEARYAAMRSFGAIQPMKEAYRDRLSFTTLETTAQDLRYAVRTLRKNPPYTLASVTLLALAMGASTAIFSVLNTVVLQPLPYPAPEQLAILWTENPSQNVREGRASFWTVEQWRRQARSFTDLAVIDPVSATLTFPDRTEKISVSRVSPNFFPMLGLLPLHGRIFSSEEAQRREPVAVISHEFWRVRFAASPAVVGQHVEIDGVPARITGVLPPGIQLPRFEADIWQPHTAFSDWEARRQVRGADSWFVLARLRPGVTFSQAQEEMSAVARRVEAESPLTGISARDVSVAPLSLHVVGSRSRTILWTLTGAVLCVLLIAAANVGGLSLARGVNRGREFAIRAALGASSSRMLRQLLVEGIALAALAGLAGSALALAGIHFVRTFGPTGLPRLNAIAVDLRVLAWTLAICLLTGILVGLAPAVTLPRPNLKPTRTAGALRRALVVAEFAVAVILLAGAGLLIRSWFLLGQVNLGFKPDRVLSLQVSTPPGMPPSQRPVFYSRVLEEIATQPGVENAAVVSELFISAGPERIVATEDGAVNLRLRSDEVSEQLFRTLGTPLLRGRLFSPEDGRGSAKVVIVTEALARRLWPERDPVGRRVRVGAVWFTVIGVVGDMRRQGMEHDPMPQMFEPLAQNPPRLGVIVVRTAVDDPLTMAAAATDAVRRVNKQAPVYAVATLEQRLAGYLVERRFQTALLTGFSALALLMASIGIYGVIRFSIASRVREIGIRIALGAQRREILRMAMEDGMKLTLAGLAIGLGGALWIVQAGRSLLFGVTPADPITFASALLLLLIVAAAACYLPARQAAKIDPSVALRCE